MSQVISFSLTDAQCEMLAKLSDGSSTSLICKTIVVEHLTSLSNIADQDRQDTIDSYIAKRFGGLTAQLTHYIESEVKARLEHLTPPSYVILDDVAPPPKPKGKRGRPKKVVDPVLEEVFTKVA